MTTLTENQKKRTIANKISIGKPVLVCPDAVYWPLLDDKNHLKFKDLLTKFSAELTYANSASENPEKIAKHTRPAVTIPDGVKKHFKIGVNSTIRSLEAKKTECLLISADISPAFLAKHIIAMALNRNPSIVIAVVTDLSSIFKHLFGIGCCVCAGEDFPRDLRALLHKATENYEKPQHFRLNSTPFVNLAPEKLEPDPPVDFEKVYLRKPSDGSRAFDPTAKSTNIAENPKNWDDFICFNDDDKMDTDEGSDKEQTIESTVIQLKDLNLPSLKDSLGALAVKKKKTKRKKVKAEQSEVKYVSAVARKIYGNQEKKKKNKNV